MITYLRCTDVCMDSTGKYWISVLNILENDNLSITLSQTIYTKPQQKNKSDRYKCIKAHHGRKKTILIICRILLNCYLAHTLSCINHIQLRVFLNHILKMNQKYRLLHRLLIHYSNVGIPSKIILSPISD